MYVHTEMCIFDLWEFYDLIAKTICCFFFCKSIRYRRRQYDLFIVCGPKFIALQLEVMQRSLTIIVKFQLS